MNARPQIDEILDSLYPAPTKFQLVCYSQGGLVARMLLDLVRLKPPGVAEYYIAERTEKVVQIDTPNAGTCIADNLFNLDWLPWVGDLGVDEMLEFNSKHDYTTDPRPGKDVPFYLITGTDPNLPWYVEYLLRDGCLQNYMNDGIVPELSTLSLFSYGYTVAGWVQRYRDHLDIYSDAVVVGWIYYWLTL